MEIAQFQCSCLLPNTASKKNQTAEAIACFNDVPLLLLQTTDPSPLSPSTIIVFHFQ